MQDKEPRRGTATTTITAPPKVSTKTSEHLPSDKTPTEKSCAITELEEDLNLSDSDSSTMTISAEEIERIMMEEIKEDIQPAKKRKTIQLEESEDEEGQGEKSCQDKNNETDFIIDSESEEESEVNGKKPEENKEQEQGPPKVQCDISSTQDDKKAQREETPSTSAEKKQPDEQDKKAENPQEAIQHSAGSIIEQLNHILMLTQNNDPDNMEIEIRLKIKGFEEIVIKTTPALIKKKD